MSSIVGSPAKRPARSSVFDRLELDRALAGLPPGYRVVFVLFEVEGYTHDETGLLLGCSPGTSKSQLHKARTKLRALLRERQTGGSIGKGQPTARRAAI